jgi:hypothetical protein
MFSSSRRFTLKTNKGGSQQLKSFNGDLYFETEKPVPLFPKVSDSSPLSMWLHVEVKNSDKSYASGCAYELSPGSNDPILPQSSRQELVRTLNEPTRSAFSSGPFFIGDTPSEIIFDLSAAVRVQRESVHADPKKSKRSRVAGPKVPHVSIHKVSQVPLAAELPPPPTVALAAELPIPPPAPPAFKKSLKNLRREHRLKNEALALKRQNAATARDRIGEIELQISSALSQSGDQLLQDRAARKLLHEQHQLADIEVSILKYAREVQAIDDELAQRAQQRTANESLLYIGVITSLSYLLFTLFF